MTPVFKLSADAPIETGASDLLGRAGFAMSCAEAIANWQDDASLVVAIWGDWGSGKSSLKNLIVEKLRDLEEDRRPTIVQFNPWQTSRCEPTLERLLWRNRESSRTADRQGRQGNS
jgi:predicted KAP-like P-loop ATPase